jgi:hypothetical protein
MKNILFCCVLIFTIASTVNCQQSDEKINDKSGGVKNNPCKNNSDDLYNREKIFKQLADLLNNSIPEYKANLGFGFEVKNEEPVGFGIYDLTDTSNKYLDKNDCINFINEHIYNVFPFFHPFSFNHIIILEDGVLTNFNSVNCLDRGNAIKEVSDYLNLKISDNNSNKETLLERVKNYRQFGKYVRACAMSRLRCETGS